MMVDMMMMVVVALVGWGLLVGARGRGNGRTRGAVSNGVAVGRQAGGCLSRRAEEALEERYLLTTQGTAADGIVRCGATDRPLGFCVDAIAAGELVERRVTVEAPPFRQTQLGMAGAAVAVGDILYTGAAGRVTPTAEPGCWYVGEARSAVSATEAAAGGEDALVEITPHRFGQAFALADLTVPFYPSAAAQHVTGSANPTPAVNRTVRILAEGASGPTTPTTVTLPTITGTGTGTNGLFGVVVNESGTLTHLLDGSGSQPVNGSTNALALPPRHVALVFGVGGPSDGWRVVVTPLTEERRLTTSCVLANTPTQTDGKAHVTGQVRDSLGNAVAGVHLVAVWLASTGYAAETTGGLAAKANSALVAEVVADGYALVATHTDGSWGVEYTVTPGTFTAHAVLQGPVGSSSAVGITTGEANP